MDKLIQSIVALGVPGFVLLVVISIKGLVGAAALTSALAFLGGPFGMIGGLFSLGLIGLIARGVAQYGVENIAKGVVEGLLAKKSKQEVIMEITNFPLISKGIKRVLLEHVEKYGS